MATYNVSRNAEGKIIVSDSAGVEIPGASNIRILVPPISGGTIISLTIEGDAHIDGSVYPHGIS